MYTLDECPDANGFWTIRPYDGTVNGDTSKLPVATVFSYDDAVKLVGLLNSSLIKGF